MSPILPELDAHVARHLVVMGVSGTGKSAVGGPVAERLGWAFAEGDAFHPASNIAKMEAGTPLTDEDRWPWLRVCHDWMVEQDAVGRSSVLTCSALRRVYRDLLREGLPGVIFLHLVADHDLILARMRARQHFFPPGLLDSQFATLEPLEDDEPGMLVDMSRPLKEIVSSVVDDVRR